LLLEGPVVEVLLLGCGKMAFFMRATACLRDLLSADWVSVGGVGVSLAGCCFVSGVESVSMGSGGLVLVLLRVVTRVPGVGAGSALLVSSLSSSSDVQSILNAVVDSSGVARAPVLLGSC